MDVVEYEQHFACLCNPNSQSNKFQQLYCHYQLLLPMQPFLVRPHSTARKNIVCVDYWGIPYEHMTKDPFLLFLIKARQTERRIMCSACGWKIICAFDYLTSLTFIALITAHTHTYKLHECDFSYGLIRTVCAVYSMCGGVFAVLITFRLAGSTVAHIDTASILISWTQGQCDMIPVGLWWTFDNGEREMCTRIHLISSNKMPAQKWPPEIKLLPLIPFARTQNPMKSIVRNPRNSVICHT